MEGVLYCAGGGGKDDAAAVVVGNGIDMFGDSGTSASPSEVSPTLDVEGIPGVANVDAAGGGG